MSTQVVCVGGIHGAGKSTIRRVLSDRFGWVAVKQRKLLTQIGVEDGLPLVDVIARYDTYIDRAADRIVELVARSHSGVLLIDCHYAIPRVAADRRYGDGREFVPNLDWRLIQQISERVNCRFVLLEVPPREALMRITDRPDAEHYANTFEHFIREAVAERDMFNQVIAHFHVSTADQCRIFTNDFERVQQGIIEFIKPASSGNFKGHP